MKILGNILWIITGGILTAFAWALAGCLWCITIVGIPLGIQCFKFARLSFLPFGKKIIYGNMGGVKIVLNVFWLILSGLELFVLHALLGVILCVTIIGIPFGIQHFKIAKLAFLPFGAKVTVGKKNA